MTTKVKLTFNNASIGNDTQALHDIHLKNKNITIYKRNIELWQQQLEQLTNNASFRHQTSGTITEIMASLQSYSEGQLSEYDFLLKDVFKLLNVFQQVTQATSFRILLATVSTNMCRKFHTDINNLRLICTYVGPGTLWLPNEIINLKALKTRSKNENIVLDENLIQQVDTGDIVILKGALYPEGNAVLHRSPTIEETGEKRLLLRIDINENLWT